MEFAFLDIEATGPNPYRSRILEISIIITDRNLIERERFSSLIRADTRIEKKSYDIHGISERELVDAPEFSEISNRIRDMLLGKVVVGYRIWDFDINLLNLELARSNTLTIFPEFIDLKDMEEIPAKKSLFHMARSLNIRPTRLHRATPDARTTLKIIRRITEKYGNKSIERYVRKPSNHPKLLQLVKNTNAGYLSNIIYRSKYNISEHIGFPVLIRNDHVIFRNTYLNRNFRLLASRIIRIERVK